ncbi:hypothetical protein [Chryseobacterium echinoideorum]|uniref:hypothetical protein n=1 Tax=Chryseobacterium echinoideorum TaxID=1549648 RepID=UPI00118718A8|nr:hypothetical protein [Chryseobacterium echinoideorum]
MKKILGIILMLLFAVSCNNQKMYSDYDISFSRSGGFAPTYENLLIKNNKAYYSFEGQEKKIKRKINISDSEIKNLNDILSKNNFRQIQEDHKKIYDNITTSVNIKKGTNAGSKNDGSAIMPNYEKNWGNIVTAFQKIINKKIKN